MQPIDFNDMPDEVFLEDIFDLTDWFPKEFPSLFEKIKSAIGIDEKYLYLTDFVENECKDNHYYGYIFNVLNQQYYTYAFENKHSKITPVASETLTLKDTFSLKVKHLLSPKS